LLSSADNIRIVSESFPEDVLFQEARSIISEAEIVLFLGFGFHRQNVERLKLRDVVSAGCEVSGTVYGFTTAEFEHNVIHLFDGIDGTRISRNDHTVMTFLRENVGLFVD
jgi:hypothetical protein